MDFVPGVLIIFYVYIVVVTSSLMINSGESKRIFNVVDYGAVGDGQTDDSRAFLRAWKAFCEADEYTPTLQIPKGKTFLLQPIKFNGPCKSQNVQVQILGKIVAPASIQAWKDCKSKCWLWFNYVNGLIMRGSGTIDGRGSAWWKALYLHGCNNFNLREFTIQNSQRMHIAINNCNGGSISNIHINSPADSPNTDGIDLSNSTRVHIHDSLIESGDDCVAINGGCNNINVTRIACGPGHGISVGSLGDREVDTVDQVNVRNCNFTRTDNGARIKTFRGGLGYARNIHFKEILLKETKNPIIIDQSYTGIRPKITTDSVQVNYVSFVNVYGTSASEQAITLDCSSSVKGCTNIVIKQVNITSSKPGNEIRALCKNAHGIFESTTPHVSCS
ncbi:hypothetical protein EZV62_013121 [Acer yangbiense]|uniref:Pectate lyase superfamily protein domain-containing protein n=1 Tax=Acer yangbiense TaxID=1000413 RepID=A0A5C7HY29_9ROSI|nr:hypothetical protein EZV62_013121 [Acer yangbiense]